MPITAIDTLPPRLAIDAEYVRDSLADLVGHTILEATVVVTVEEDGTGANYWPVIVTRGPDGAHRTLVIQADPEGNGPGFPRIEGL